MHSSAQFHHSTKYQIFDIHAIELWIEPKRRNEKEKLNSISSTLYVSALILFFTVLVVFDIKNTFSIRVSNYLERNFYFFAWSLQPADRTTNTNQTMDWKQSSQRWKSFFLRIALNQRNCRKNIISIIRIFFFCRLTLLWDHKSNTLLLYAFNKMEENKCKCTHDPLSLISLAQH